MRRDLDEDTITLPRGVRFPVELIPPEGFDPERPQTWPSFPGRLEYVEGRLLYMPPYGDVQQDTVSAVVGTLFPWASARAGEFTLASNEAGMRLLGSTRAADAAIWRRRDLAGYSGGLRRVPPVLAVEVAGVDDRESELREKAAWYLAAGVPQVWLVLPDAREVVVLRGGTERRCRPGEPIPDGPELPGLHPDPAEFFAPLTAGERDRGAP